MDKNVTKQTKINFVKEEKIAKMMVKIVNALDKSKYSDIII